MIVCDFEVFELHTGELQKGPSTVTVAGESNEQGQKVHARTCSLLRQGAQVSSRACYLFWKLATTPGG